MELTMNKIALTLSTVAFGLLLLPTGEASAKACGHSWAVPGSYTISGNFRGKVESAGARLSRDCRVSIQVPGVFSNTRVRSAGSCLRFSFKVEGIKKAFSAKWCNKVGVIPWKGKSIRTKIRFVKRSANTAGGGTKKQNFN